MSINVQDIQDIHLTITEETHGVNLTVTESEDLDFSVHESSLDVHLLVSEENVNIEIKQGDDGLSAYQIWLKEGNVGTESDFLRSLQGETSDANLFYTKVQLQTAGQSQVNWNNITSLPSSFNPSPHDHDGRYYTKSESNERYIDASKNQSIGGIKTFANNPIVPTATLGEQAVNLGQVQNIVTSVLNEIEENDKFKTTISSSGEVEHFLNTYDVTAEFYDISTMYTVGARVQRLTTNKIKVEFDTQPTSPVKVLIRKF